MAVRTVDHPLAQHLLTLLRKSDTDPEKFRRYAKQLSQLLLLSGLRDMPSVSVSVQTPMQETEGSKLGVSLVVVPILRAGMAMLEPALALFPEVSVGYVGLERNHETAEAASYYCKLPDMTGRWAVCVDPMLATGGSASQAVSLIKEKNPEKILMISVVSAPEGIERFLNDHPDVEIVTAAIDEGLDENKYILPGLGDFGDRLYGT
jgi:uracil phosphoribosyltransferase